MLNSPIARSLALLLGLLVVFPAAGQGTTRPRGPVAYILNADDNTVSVLDTANNVVKATIPVGACPDGVAVTRDGRRVYVANGCDATVSVIDAGSNAVVATIPVGNEPFGVAVTPDAANVYVANAADDTVSVIATATNTVTATVAVDGPAPYGVAVTPDGTRIYVSNCDDPIGTVSVIARPSNTLIATVTVGNCPSGVAFTPNGARAYVANCGDTVDPGTVSVIDTATNTVTATVTVGVCPQGVAVTPDGAFVYVGNQFDNNVSVIATATNTVTATVPVGAFPQALAVNLDGATVYVANGDDDTVSVIATASNTVTATVPVGGFPAPFGIFIGPYIDTTGPEFEKAHPDVSAEATSSTGANVFYVLPTATDDVGVASISCSPASGTRFALGSTTVACTATDTSGNRTMTAFVVRVVDTTPPRVNVPGTLTVLQSSPAGAVATFAVTATDLVDGTIAASCTPASGSLFAPGNTTVSCTATDARGNVSSVATFTVHVSDVVAQMSHLISLVKKLGPAVNLKIATALATIAIRHKPLACLVLKFVADEVKSMSGKKIPAAKATEIINAVKGVRAALGC